MKSVHEYCPRRFLTGLLAFCLLSTLFPWAGQAQERFDTLVVNHQVYSNVVVQSRTRTHLSFNHDKGFASVKLSDISPTSSKAMGYEAEDSGKGSRSSPKTVAARMAPELLKKTMAMSGPVQEVLLPKIMQMLWIIVGVLVLGHLIVSFCFMSICHKAGKEPGLAVWIPIIQMFPLLKAANMSGWTFLLFLLPLVNVLATLMWCVKICQALNKGPLLGLLLFLPATGIFVLFYLAFSGGDESEEPQVIKLDYPETLPSTD